MEQRAPELFKQEWDQFLGLLLDKDVKILFDNKFKK
jgi:hypothetical protein